jgi:hypothetical protein
MKVTHFGPGGLPVAVGGWSSGIVSLNSNVEIIGGGPAALNFVQRITSNTSNTLLNPIVNFASGSNIAFAVQSNTLTIIGAAGGGGAAPVISAGSNSTRVSEVSGAGASTTLWSPFDHAHDGIGTITASSSNTMQRGTWNVRPGAGIALALSDTDGDGEFDTATIVNTLTPGTGGFVGRSFIGYNTVGASFENITVNRQYMKKLTLASAGTIMSIDIHIKATNTDPTGFMVHVLQDSSGLPTLVRAASAVFATSAGLGLKGGNAARWVAFPIGAYLEAGDYWIGFTSTAVGTSVIAIAYDTSGSDRYFTIGPYALDGDYASTTDSTRKFSIRGNFLS